MSTTNTARVMTPEQIAAAIADAAQFSNRFDAAANRRPFIGQDYERRWIRLDRMLTALAMKLDEAAPGAFKDIGDFLAAVSYDKDVAPAKEQSK
jgi:hypothetical protein